VVDIASSLDGTLEGCATVLVQDNDSGVGVNSLAQVKVKAGVPVLIQAGSSIGNTGAYQVAWSQSTDDFGDTPGSAQELAVENNIFSQQGRLGTGTDNDWFTFTADRDGLVTFRMEPDGDASGVDPYLFVLDDSLAIVGSSSRLGGGRLAEVSVAVAAGDILYLQAASLGRTIGGYRLSGTVIADDYGGSSENAFEVELDDRNQLAELAGAVNISFDTDWFQVVARADGRVRVSLAGVDGFDPAVTVYDADGRVIAANDDFGGSTNSRVDVRFNSSEVYFIQVSGFGSSEGAYVLRFDAVAEVADDHGDTPDLASTLFPDETGMTRGTGRLGHDTDSDYLRLIPTKSGTGTLDFTASSELGASARVRVYTLLDGKPVQVGSAQGAAGLRVPFPVTAGQDLFVRIDSPTGGIDDYSFEVKIAEVSSGERPIDADALRAISDEFNRAFIQRISAMQNPSDIYNVQEQIARDLVASYIAANGLPSGNVLLIFLDPVDFVAEDPSGRQVGQTTGGGTIMENTAASVSSRGALDLVVVPNAAAGQFQMQLLGVGGGRVMAGAIMLTKDGSTVNPAVSVRGQAVSGNIPVGEVPKEGLQLVLDFRPDRGNSGGTGGTGNNGGGTGGTGGTGNTGGGETSVVASSAVVSSVVNSTLVQTLSGLTSGFGADLASVGAQLTPSLTTLLLVATTSDGAKQGDGSALGNVLNSGSFQQSFRSVITITGDVAQALVRTGEYLVRTLPKAERLLAASLAPARQLANATLLPAVRDTIGKVVGDAATTALKQVDVAATAALKVLSQNAAKVPGVMAPKKANDGARSQGQSSEDRGQSLAHLFVPGQSETHLVDTQIPSDALNTKPQDPLWAAIGTLGDSHADSPVLAREKKLLLAVEDGVRSDSAARRKLAGLAAAGLLAPSWVAAMQPGKEQPKPGVTPRRQKPKNESEGNDGENTREKQESR
ncbi:MAG: PPC domain-containing protein, partial [Gemmataceae bacterium]